MAKARIPIPRVKDAPELLKLSGKIYAKHQTDGVNSPVRGELAGDWATVGPKIVQAQADHDEAKRLEKIIEKHYQNRDLVLAEVEPVVKQTRDLLVGFYGQKKLRHMGDHGFVVNDTPLPPKGDTPAKP